MWQALGVPERAGGRCRQLGARAQGAAGVRSWQARGERQQERGGARHQARGRRRQGRAGRLAGRPVRT